MFDDKVLTILVANTVLIVLSLSATACACLWSRRKSDKERTLIMELIHEIRNDRRDFENKMAMIEKHRQDEK